MGISHWQAEGQANRYTLGQGKKIRWWIWHGRFVARSCFRSLVVVSPKSRAKSSFRPSTSQSRPPSRLNASLNCIILPIPFLRHLSLSFVLPSLILPFSYLLVHTPLSSFQLLRQVFPLPPVIPPETPFDFLCPPFQLQHHLDTPLPKSTDHGLPSHSRPYFLAVSICGTVACLELVSLLPDLQLYTEKATEKHDIIITVSKSSLLIDAIFHVLILDRILVFFCLLGH
ncbi:hypothetical protein F5Y18DRAFT_337796 [Xylariaceae sp. FL1019]|nr:hypothetical protein F5Y18DRAFT_337796 [Xylariaceae sp. FL1019]